MWFFKLHWFLTQRSLSSPTSDTKTVKPQTKIIILHFFRSLFLFLCTTCKSTWLIFMFSIIKTLLLLYRAKMPFVRPGQLDQALCKCNVLVMTNRENCAWPYCSSFWAGSVRPETALIQMPRSDNSMISAPELRAVSYFSKRPKRRQNTCMCNNY